MANKNNFDNDEVISRAFAFVENSLKENLPSKDDGFHSVFKNGILLCKLVNTYTPGAIPKISLKEFPFLQIENLNMFVNACQGYGVAPNELFEAFDFYEGNNIYKAVECVLALERQIKGGEKLLQQRLIKKKMSSNNNIARQPSEIKKTTNSLQTLDINDTDSSDFAYLARQEQGESNLKSVILFIEKTLGETLTTHNLHEFLKDGIILCRLMNTLAPNSIPVITTKKHPYQQMQNIFNFLNAARSFGVKQTELFQTADLFEGKDMPQVVITLNALARLSNTKAGEKRSTSLTNLTLETTEKKDKLRKTSKPRLHSDKVVNNVKGMTITNNMNEEFLFGPCIGRGHFGAVYKGMNMVTGETVAIKRVPQNVNMKDALMKEVELMKSLNHQNIVKLIGFVQQDNSHLNIILEFVENGSLLNMLKQFGPFPETIIQMFTVGILDGLIYLHSRNIVHCDLKAANILLTKSGQVKLSDFGVSKNFEFTPDVSVAGTPNWMAPEIIELTGPNTASDIWSLGCTLIELITGKPPLAEYNPMTVLFKIVEEEISLPDGLGHELQDFLGFCFVKDPEKRPSARILRHHTWITKFNLNKLSEVPKTQETMRIPAQTSIKTSSAYPRQETMGKSQSDEGVHIPKTESFENKSKKQGCQIM